MLRNLKISHKISLLTTLGTILLIIVGIIGLLNMKKMDDNTNNLYDNNVMSLESLYSIQNNIAAVSADMEHLINSSFKAAVTSKENDISILSSLDDKLFKEYEKLPHPDKSEQQNYNAVKQKLADYRSARDEVLKLVDAGNYSDAYSAYSDKYSSLKDNLDNAISSVVLDDTKYAQNTVASNKTAFNSSLIFQIAVIVIGSVILSVLGILLSAWLRKRIAIVIKFANNLSNGDLTHKLPVLAKDEIGTMAIALNSASSNMKELIGEIISGMKEVGASSADLTSNIEEISASMLNIKNSSESITNSNMELTASTEEVSASAEEINKLVSILDEKASSGKDASCDIASRAAEIKKAAEKSSNEILSLYSEKETHIKHALDNINVVNEINTMTEAIVEIADQTNLLALNASIEASRAGEAGKGFAVVAEEVRNLAEETGNTVSEIRRLVGEVKNVTDDLKIHTSDILHLIDNKIKPDYEAFKNVGIHYEKDSEFMMSMSTRISDSTDSITASISEVNASITNISATTQQSASNSEEILASISETSNALEHVAKSAQVNSELAEKLTSMTSKFKI